jgi:hypothetical protein
MWKSLFGGGDGMFGLWWHAARESTNGPSAVFMVQASDIEQRATFPLSANRESEKMLIES